MTYRTAENEILDIRTEEARGFLAKHYPAVMADRPVGMSDAYQFMPSYKIAETLIDKFGLGLVSVSQQFSRRRDPKGQEHFMRFRLPDTMSLKAVGDSVPELVIMNSHNGRSTLRAYAGVFRLICSNGMVVADKTFGKISLRHFGAENNYEAFGGVLDTMGANFRRMDLRMQMLDQLMLTPGQQIGLARALMKARGVPGWVEPQMVLKARREIEMPAPDGTRSVWKTYNVLQESLAEARDVSFERAGARARSLRPLSGARAQVLTNERLWTALEEFVAHHWPELASEIMEGEASEVDTSGALLLGQQDHIEDADVIPEEAVEVADALATPVAPEDHGQAAAAQEEPIVRPFDELMSLSYEEMETMSDEELKGLGKDERSKLSKRKSYLKKKAGL